jgi:hypothetical protein
MATIGNLEAIWQLIRTMKSVLVGMNTKLHNQAAP